MDAIGALRSYIEAVLANVHEMKVLLFDDETSHMASLVYTQSELLKHDVVLIESLQSRIPKPVDEALTCLQCVCVIRPTTQNIHDLCRELNCPHFNSYYIFFTNVVKREGLQQIAFADHQSKVFVIHEIFVDVLALNRRLFSLGVSSCIQALERSGNEAKMQRIVDGLFSLLCSFKLKTAIRVDAQSQVCRAIGERLSKQVTDNSDLFQNTNATSMVLLVDRRFDPMTPLLHTWSYQGLLHEILGIRNNIVVQKGGQRKTVVVDERTDEFFAANLFTNYGDLGDAVNALTEGVKAQHTDVRDIKDVEALKKFIHTYPVYQEKQAFAAKHAGVLGEISDAVKREKLIQFAPMEQKIAVQDDQQTQLGWVMDAIRDSEVTDQNALRLALLYCLHYQNASGSNIDGVKEALMSRRNGDRLAMAVDKYLSWAGQSYRRSEALFATKSLFSKAKNLIGLDENKFDLYTPGLQSIIQKIEKRQLDPASFPFIRELPGTMEPKKFIIFFVGGATYEEGRIGYQAAANGMDVLIGGSTIHNMDSFVWSELMETE